MPLKMRDSYGKLAIPKKNRDAAIRRDETYKRVVVRHHNARVRPLGIQVGDWVLRKNLISHKEPNKKLDAT